MRLKNKIILCFLSVTFISFVCLPQSLESHPNLLLTKTGVEEIHKRLGSVPLFDNSFNDAKNTIDEALNRAIEVPIPKDPGGGYTHEKHKQNYNEMYLAGILYSVTSDERYARFIKDMLDKYAEMYPTLGHHPQSKEEAPGRMFWQSLNETVWLLHTIQAYDCIYSWLNPADRIKYEKNIFLPMTAFFTDELTEEFNLIHNHGTWMVASVGMTGFVLNNQDLIDKSLYGAHKDGVGGFMKQLDNLFSPDGYYTEGGYYVRYALWPFFIFAESIQNNRPDLKIYDYRDQILKKAFYSALQMTYTNGEFMPINDALKEKTWLSIEMVYALNFVYNRYGADEMLLSIAKKQNKVTLTDAGIKVAEALEEFPNPKAFEWKSVEYRDGPQGNQGGVGILRYGPASDMETMLFKYSAHGLSHGHYDKLSFLFYDQGREIIQDYGAARFLNVEQKSGGRYVLENKTFALQTIAHNTIVVDEKSNFDGKKEQSEKYSPNRYYFSSSDSDFQVVSAKDEHAYKGVKMHRTIAMVNDKSFTRPVLIDVFKVNSNEQHQYDLPFYYMGHFIYANFNFTPFVSERKLFGKKNGYQHLWLEAEASPKGTSTVTWLNGERYYSITSNTDSLMNIYFTRIGGTDPNFNLRNDPALIFRTKGKDHVFASIIEPHGDFNPTLEYSFNPYSAFEKIEVLFSNDEYTIVNIIGKKDLNWIFAISNKDNSSKTKHKVKLENGTEMNWQGTVTLIKK